MRRRSWIARSGVCCRIITRVAGATPGAWGEHSAIYRDRRAGSLPRGGAECCGGIVEAWRDGCARQLEERRCLAASVWRGACIISCCCMGAMDEGRFAAGGGEVLRGGVSVCGFQICPRMGRSSLKTVRFGNSDFEASIPAAVLGEARARFHFPDEPAGLWGMSMGGAFLARAASLPGAPWKALVVVCSFDSLDAVVGQKVASYTSVTAPLWARLSRSCAWHGAVSIRLRCGWRNGWAR